VPATVRGASEPPLVDLVVSTVADRASSEGAQLAKIVSAAPAATMT
jgi:hypothetical protein